MKPPRFGLAHGLGACALLSALSVLWLPEWPPGTDAPQHLLVAAVRASPEQFTGWLAPNTAWTGQGFGTLAGWFARWMSLAHAAALAQTIPALLAAAGVWDLARRHGGQPAPAMACVLAFMVGWPCAMGFFNFTCGLGLGLAAAACVDRGAASRAPGWGWLGMGAALSVAGVWAHMYGGAVAVAHAILLRVVTSRRREEDWSGVRMTTLAVLPAVIWTGVCLVRARTLQLDSYFGDAQPWLQPGPSEWIRDLLWTQSAGQTRLAALATVASILGILWTVRVPPAGGRSPWQTAWPWLVAFLFLPIHGMGWGFIHMRVGVFLWALPWIEQRSARARRAGMIVAALACGGMIMEAQAARRAGAALAQIEHGLRGDGGRQTRVLWFDGPTAADAASRAPFVRPSWHAGLYASWTGTALSTVNDYNRVTHGIRPAGAREGLFPDPRQGFVPSQIPACAGDGSCPQWPTLTADRILATSRGWASLALVEPPASLMQALHQRGAVDIAPTLLAPPNASLRVDLPATDTAVRLELRASPTNVVFGRVAGPGGDARSVRFDQLPHATVHLRWTTDGGRLLGEATLQLSEGLQAVQFSADGSAQVTPAP